MKRYMYTAFVSKTVWSLWQCRSELSMKTCLIYITIKCAKTVSHVPILYSAHIFVCVPYFDSILSLNRHHHRRCKMKIEIYLRWNVILRLWVKLCDLCDNVGANCRWKDAGEIRTFIRRDRLLCTTDSVWTLEADVTSLGPDAEAAGRRVTSLFRVLKATVRLHNSINRLSHGNQLPARDQRCRRTQRRYGPCDLSSGGTFRSTRYRQRKRWDC